MPKFTTKVNSQTRFIHTLHLQIPISFDRDGTPLCFAELDAPIIVISTEECGDHYEHVVRIATMWVPRIIPPS